MTLLSFPLDSTAIVRKKKSLRRDLLRRQDTRQSKRIAILGGSTTHEITKVWELFLLDSGIEPQFFESEYNQFYEDALFSKELEHFNPDLIYIHTTQHNLQFPPSLKHSEEDIAKNLLSEFQRFESIWSSLAKYDCPIIQNNFDLPTSRSLGNLDCYDFRGRSLFINKLNLEFAEAARSTSNLYLNDINYLSSYLGLKRWFDETLWYQAKYAVSLDAIPYLTHNLNNIACSVWGLTKKCLVLDLDNTCWGGVIGDDGLDGISIGSETAIAESYSDFQKYAKELNERGITLAVCSKNDQRNAESGFTHPDSVLKLSDFVSFKANWKPKNLNIEEIAQEVNIGLDSLVFVDDNPAERDLVLSQLPSVSVPNVGSDVIDFRTHLDRGGFFEPTTLSKDDIQRNKYYAANSARINEQAQFSSYDDFLTSLQMTAEICHFKTIYFERIAQLINKTNQFNLTTTRMTLGEVTNASESPNFVTLYGKLTDKYGENGLVSVVIASLTGNRCHIQTWLMSCRVLKRNMENAMMDSLVERCRQKNIKEIIGYYYKTKKNSMVADFYKNFGFALTDKNNEDTVWKLNIDSYENMNQHIGVTLE